MLSWNTMSKATWIRKCLFGLTVSKRASRWGSMAASSRRGSRNRWVLTSGDIFLPTRPHLLKPIQTAHTNDEQIFKYLSLGETFPIKPQQGVWGLWCVKLVSSLGILHRGGLCLHLQPFTALLYPSPLFSAICAAAALWDDSVDLLHCWCQRCCHLHCCLCRCVLFRSISSTCSTYNIEEKKVRIPKKKPFSGSNVLIPEGKWKNHPL